MIIKGHMNLIHKLKGTPVNSRIINNNPVGEIKAAKLCENINAFTIKVLGQFTFSAKGAKIGIVRTANPELDWMKKPNIRKINIITIAKGILLRSPMLPDNA